MIINFGHRGQPPLLPDITETNDIGKEQKNILKVSRTSNCQNIFRLYNKNYVYQITFWCSE